MPNDNLVQTEEAPVATRRDAVRNEAPATQLAPDAESSTASFEQNEESVTSTNNEELPKEEVASEKASPDHSIWDGLLNKFVSASGKVNYNGFRSATDQLNAYLSELAKATPTGDWSRESAMAYWINAYNAFTIKLIIDNWPLRSIRAIDNGNPWDTKWIELGGKTYSLNQIEKEILLPKYQDPRIHFAVNCAAASCPPLYNNAFTAANLNSSLEKLARNFINNPRYNTISSSAAEVSKIFEWYGSDFGDVRTYLDKYAKADLAKDAPITFKEYDWALNN